MKSRYIRMLQARKKRQFQQGEEDAFAGKPPARDELAYIQGYEKGLFRRKNSMSPQNDIDTM